jgi:uncharacterized protein
MLLLRGPGDLSILCGRRPVVIGQLTVHEPLEEAVEWPMIPTSSPGIVETLLGLGVRLSSRRQEGHMSHTYRSIAFTGPVLDSQVEYGSRAALNRVDRQATSPDEERGRARDPMGAAEREFIAEQDGFYLATVSESGWPYVQFRGGPRGFVTSPDEHTLAWADFRGNRQYISTGNLHHDPRAALIFLDYAHQLRLKIFGYAEVTDVHRSGLYSGSLAVPGYRGRVEREVRIDVSAFDWNCPQHITPRYTAEELAPIPDTLQRRVSDLEAENTLLRAQLATTTQASPA